MKKVSIIIFFLFYFIFFQYLFENILSKHPRVNFTKLPVALSQDLFYNSYQVFLSSIQSGNYSFFIDSIKDNNFFDFDDTVIQTNNTVIQTNKRLDHNFFVSKINSNKELLHFKDIKLSHENEFITYSIDRNIVLKNLNYYLIRLFSSNRDSLWNFSKTGNYSVFQKLLNIPLSKSNVLLAKVMPNVFAINLVLRTQKGKIILHYPEVLALRETTNDKNLILIDIFHTVKHQNLLTDNEINEAYIDEIIIFTKSKYNDKPPKTELLDLRGFKTTDKNYFLIESTSLNDKYPFQYNILAYKDLAKIQYISSDSQLKIRKIRKLSNNNEISVKLLLEEIKKNLLQIQEKFYYTDSLSIDHIVYGYRNIWFDNKKITNLLELFNKFNIENYTFLSNKQIFSSNFYLSAFSFICTTFIFFCLLLFCNYKKMKLVSIIENDYLLLISIVNSFFLFNLQIKSFHTNYALSFTIFFLLVIIYNKYRFLKNIFINSFFKEVFLVNNLFLSRKNYFFEISLFFILLTILINLLGSYILESGSIPVLSEFLISISLCLLIVAIFTKD